MARHSTPIQWLWNLALASLVLVAGIELMLRAVYFQRKAENGLAVIYAMDRLAERLQPRNPTHAMRPTADQETLKRLLYASDHNRATIGARTRPTMPGFRALSLSRVFEIPENGRLDWAWGVDPGATGRFHGDLLVEIQLEVENGETHRLYERKVVLDDLGPADARWFDVHVGLDAFAGQAATLLFRKTSLTESTAGNEFFGLSPADLVYFAEPRIRTENLPSKRNVILLSIDTLRVDHLSCAGYSRNTTPTLDALAAGGVFFKTTVSHAPWTSPAHASLFTSVHPHQHGVVSPLRGAEKVIGQPTMASILESRGYVTAAITAGGAMSPQYGMTKGFSLYEVLPQEPETGRGVDAIVQRALEWLSENHQRTFFLFLHTYEPHTPYNETTFVEAEDVSESDAVAYRTALYDGDIHRADRFVGELLRGLQELGRLDDTLIVVVSDHGEDLVGRYSASARNLPFGHGYSLYDEMLMVPLIFSGPEIPSIPGGISSQVRLIDVLPTILDYLGLPPADDAEGRSLLSLMDGGAGRAIGPAYSEDTSYGFERESLRDPGFKYIRRVAGGYADLAHWRSAGMPMPPAEELYDLESDPAETMNVVTSRREKRDSLHKTLTEITRTKSYPFGVDDDRREYRGDEIQKDEALMEQLRNLGYVE